MSLLRVFIIQAGAGFGCGMNDVRKTRLGFTIIPLQVYCSKFRKSAKGLNSTDSCLPIHGIGFDFPTKRFHSS